MHHTRRNPLGKLVISVLSVLYTIQFHMSISSQFCLVLDIPSGPAMCAASLPYQRPPAARGEGLGRLGHGPNNNRD